MAKAVLYSLPTFSLNTWKIEGNYIRYFIISLNIESESGSIVLDSCLVFKNQISILTLTFYLTHFEVPAFPSALIAVFSLCWIHCLVSSSVCSLGFGGWLVPEFMEHCALKFIPLIHQEFILYTSVVCSTVKWNVSSCLQETAYGAPMLSLSDI